MLKAKSLDPSTYHSPNSPSTYQPINLSTNQLINQSTYPPLKSCCSYAAISINPIIFYQPFAALQQGCFNFNTSLSKRCRQFPPHWPL